MQAIDEATDLQGHPTFWDGAVQRAEANNATLEISNIVSGWFLLCDQAELGAGKSPLCCAGVRSLVANHLDPESVRVKARQPEVTVSVTPPARTDSREMVADYVRRTTADQGLPERITDSETLMAVAAVLSVGGAMERRPASP